MTLVTKTDKEGGKESGRGGGGRKWALKAYSTSKVSKSTNHGNLGNISDPSESATPTLAIYGKANARVLIRDKKTPAIALTRREGPAGMRTREEEGVVCATRGGRDGVDAPRRRGALQRPWRPQMRVQGDERSLRICGCGHPPCI